jgi:hypothetical protein
MAPALALIHRTHQRLRRHWQLNTIGFWLPVAIIGWAVDYLILNFVSYPRFLTLLPPVICCGYLGITLWKARTVAEPESVAALLDDIVQGKERFLTVATTPQSSTALEHGFYRVITAQADALSRDFLPERDLPFVLDRRVPWAMLGAVFSVLLLFLVPSLLGSHGPFFTAPSPMETSYREEASSQEAVITEAIAKLEETARLLMASTSPPQEQMVGAQLATLIQQIQDPSLSAQEKQQLIEEARKRLNLDLPLPQLFPFDLKIFGSKGKDQSQGNEGDSQQAGKTPLEKTKQSLEQLKQSLSTATATSSNGSQQEAQQNREKNTQPQPRLEGGGIAFNLPLPREKNQDRSRQESGEAGQKPSQAQARDPHVPGSDPNYPGEGQNQNAQNQQAQNQQNQSNSPEKPGSGQDQKSGGGASVGQEKGERFLKSGDQPGGGFLTKDGRFVKVRIPIGQDAQETGDGLTANASRATPKVPYSNAPLKEGALDQAQAKQPIPLEYRSILSE